MCKRDVSGRVYALRHVNDEYMKQILMCVCVCVRVLNVKLPMKNVREHLLVYCCTCVIHVCVHVHFACLSDTKWNKRDEK